FQNQIQAASHTTPESIDLLQYLSSFQKQGCDSVVMEVSSHALHRHRVDGLEFNGAVFTNLSPEHLDYHLEMNDYFQAKAILFREHLLKSQKSNRFAILNIDDEYATKLVSDLASVQIFSFSLRSTQADLYPFNYHLNLEGVQTEIQTPWGVISLKSRLLGAFNLSNLLAAIAVGGALGISLPLIKKALEEFSFVPGRLEKIENKKGIHVFVDYAHTPDALRHVLSSLKNLKTPESRLITVFGCGGDRDRGKRPLMGNEVARGSDFAWVTSDNPRTEDPQKIIQDILPGIKAQKLDAEKSIHLQIDRRLAIQEALQFARPGDVVLIAGKGHEDYQMIGKEKIHFDDREIARSFLA
ncbi:MAG: UDP-N-acetylmuramoyl-L-alanyl-D-glutamate--2,6-diaminopimelate ligase, partial [Deltaproteobacteria bacterium]|nr:UDP-N-acetylmuramoyl-L-alanyl-D-glutamate--2,6-diaminopimelate ligase [Deltaproteobacteria bacterium]